MGHRRSGGRLTMRRLFRRTRLLTALAVLVATTALDRSTPVSAFTGTHEAELVHPAGAGADRFGTSVAIDGNTAVVGVPGDGSPSVGGNVGSAHVFVKEGDAWTHQAHLVDTEPRAGDSFGLQVAIDGDTIAVSAPSDRDESGRVVGSVHVFVRSGTIWAREARLAGPSAFSSTQFGQGVAVRGDTILVGAPRHEEIDQQCNCGTFRVQMGAAHVFARTDSQWQRVTILRDPAALADPQSAHGDEFGTAVALGDHTALIGEWRDDPEGLQDAGSVHLFDVATWQEVAVLTDPAATAFGQFGGRLAIDGQSVVVGSSSDDTAGINAGAAHIFRGGAHEATLMHPTAAGGDNFGGSVAIRGDIVAVGAAGDQTVPGSLGALAGSVQVFSRTGTRWHHEAELVHPPDPFGFNQDFFGSSVAMAGDRVVVGVPFDNTSAGSDAGSAQVFGLPIQRPPVATAGDDQTVDEGATVVLDASASTDPNGDVLSYRWEQIGGPPVTLSDASAQQPMFTAPDVPVGGATLTFRLTVDDGTHTSEADTVNVTVKSVNKPPVADAGADQTVQESSPVTLHGGGSFDPDGDDITYSWAQVDGEAITLSDPFAAAPTFTAPLVGPGGQVFTFSLTVSDGAAHATDDVQIAVSNVNQIPVADAGDDQTVDEATGVVLDATSSSDPDADTLTYAWTQIGGPAVSLSDPGTAMPSFTAPDVGPGGATMVFALVVDDGAASSAPDTVTVTVLDTNAPPVCELAQPSVHELWPPNHKMAPVTITGVSDPDDADVRITITSVTQDEPVDGLGDGDTGPDASVDGGSVLLRAERQGGGNGRVYSVSFRADDTSGGACTGTMNVSVPHDRRGAAAVDDGQHYDSR